HERHAEPRLQPLERLADRRPAYPKPLARRAESARLHHRHEHRHLVQVLGHREAQLIGLGSSVKLFAVSNAISCLGREVWSEPKASTADSERSTTWRRPKRSTSAAVKCWPGRSP